MSEFWTTTFKRIEVSMLTSTAYHPQTDGQSERTNQIIEIALRFSPYCEPRAGVRYSLTHKQNQTTSRNFSTGFALNELAYGFKVNDAVKLLADHPPEQYDRLRLIKREGAGAAMAFASAVSKTRYDQSHRPAKITPGSMVSLRLHQGYTIHGLSDKKLSSQRVGLFKVVEAVGKQTCRLELPPIVRIHPVIFIAQLEPATPEKDHYNRHSTVDPPPVTDAHTESTAPS